MPKANKYTQLEFKKFEKLFNAIQRAKKAKREQAPGTLTPDIMRAAMKGKLGSGAPISLLAGKNRAGHPFTVDDLKELRSTGQKIPEKFFSCRKRGPCRSADQAFPGKKDIVRSQKEIRNATMYRIFNGADGVMLLFRVTASPNSKYLHHRVKVRLEEWNDWLTSSVPFRQAAENILNGRISFDCDCGRHQYWYRYMATIGGYAIKPLENAYPKVRNPKLFGACCKHVLKALATIRGPAVRRLIVMEMEKAAKHVGFADDKKRGQPVPHPKGVERKRPGPVLLKRT